MKEVRSIRLVAQTDEEILPDYAPDFPYIASRVNMARYYGFEAPWHWHGAVELFYVCSGAIEYKTPGETRRIEAGGGGFVNSGVLHATRNLLPGEDTELVLHLFDPSLLSDGGRMEERYIRPLAQNRGLELVTFDPQSDGDLLEGLKESFRLDEKAFGYEFALRSRLSALWLAIMQKAGALLERGSGRQAHEEKLKEMMRYIGEYYGEELPIEGIAQAAHVSKRVCFRLFRENLHMTPVEYIRSVRLKEAVRMLVSTREPITQIGYACGLGAPSYFGKLFREQYGCTPGEYRKKWHDRDSE